MTVQLQKWADNVSEAAHNAYGHGKKIFYLTRAQAREAIKSFPKAQVTDAAHNAYGQSKKVFYLTRAEAKEALRHIPVESITASLPALKSQLHTASANARKNALELGHQLGASLCKKESLVLHMTGAYLFFKWIQNRNQGIDGMARNAKAHIVERPLTSAFIAISVGYMFGRLRKWH